MSVTKVIEVVGHSSQGTDEAVREAVTAASRSIRGISRVDVETISCEVADDQVVGWNVLVKISFPVERSA
ncbi:MAG TPA: dodecin family protein [Gaiellales bacterium]|nr:dodecin family protein [Gaiellales bacterium]